MIPSDDHPPQDLSPSDHCNQQKPHNFKINCGDKAHTSVSDIDLFADLEDNNNPQSSFSIRDYVFNSRSKNIACNWPFSDKTLRICLQHGVKNLLPPFQSLESLRTNSSNEEIITDFDKKSNSELTLESRKSRKSQSHLQQDLGQTKSKKPVFVSSRKTETETTMASKICPVCKTFSSSSNTTLNAHIDQCLSGESTIKWNANSKVIVKHRIIKPRKVRLMVDIYKTALHCTVEDLDARNGTSWANNWSFPDEELDFQGEQEKEAKTVVPEVADHEGDVYIDNNGTKVRILSVPKVDNNTSNDHGTQKKGVKSSKVFLGKKKNKSNEHKYDHKYLKSIPKSKKLCSPNPCHRASSEMAIGENWNKEDGLKKVMKKDDLPIVRPPWACSKRTVLAKKLQHLRNKAIKNSSVASDKSFSECGFKTPSSSSTKTWISLQQNSQKTGTLIGQHSLKRSRLLAKPSSKHLPSQPKYSKRSKGSSGKKTMSVSREQASKFNLEKKISVLKRSCVGPTRDSLKQLSQVEEDISGDTGHAASESVNHFENIKTEKTKICRPENSVSSRSLNEDSSWLKTDKGNHSCDVESYRKENRSHKEQVNTEFSIIVSEPDIMFESREYNDDKKMYSADFIEKSVRIDDVIDDVERQNNYHDMSDSPISTISNPSLARSDSDKFSVRSRSTSLKDDTLGDAVNDKCAPTTSGDWRSKGQSQTTGFKNDHDQPCCCSRKEIDSSKTVASSYHDLTLLRKHDTESFNFVPQMFSVSNFPPPPAPPLTMLPPSKPVLRLMGKNLTVVKTDDDVSQISPMGQFPNFQNEYKFPSSGYHRQNHNGFHSQHHTFNPNNNSMFRNKFDNQMVNMHNNTPSNPIIIEDSHEDEGNDVMNTRRTWASLHNRMPFGYQS